jgi:hypothetical protein
MVNAQIEQVLAAGEQDLAGKLSEGEFRVVQHIKGLRARVAEYMSERWYDTVLRRVTPLAGVAAAGGGVGSGAWFAGRYDGEWPMAAVAMGAGAVGGLVGYLAYRLGGRIRDGRTQHAADLSDLIRSELATPEYQSAAQKLSA